ncbi:MAG: hypothetical protein R3E83_15995 [Burkholderiaceae bacterium]
MSVDLDNRFDPMTVDLDGLLRLLTGPGGVAVRDRFHNLRRYPSCFEGTELVDVLVRHFGISRKQAVRLGRRLLAHESIRHVVGEHDFEDESLFYVFGGPGARANTDSVPDISSEALVELALSMRTRDGVSVRSHRHWLIDYPQSFVGAEAVDWIVNKTALDRDGATAVGRALLARNLIRHVLDEHDFEDARLLYRFV